MDAPVMHLALETEHDRAAVEAIIDRAFGPGRFTKAAERLREGRAPHLELSVVAFEDGAAVGCVRQWPIKVGVAPALLLGPIAVDVSRRSDGVGGLLMDKALAVADAEGWRHVLLVGDLPYFGRWGFTRAAVSLPGPVDPRRVLARSPPGEALTGLATAKL